MKYLLFMFLFVGCSDHETFELLMDTKKHGCIRVSNVTYGDVSLGEFVICTADEYDKRIGEKK